MKITNAAPQTPLTSGDIPQDNASNTSATSPATLGLASPQEVHIDIKDAPLAEPEESKKKYDQQETQYQLIETLATNLPAALYAPLTTAANIALNVTTLSPAVIAGSVLTGSMACVAVADTICEYVNTQRKLNGEAELPMKGNSIGGAAHYLAECCGYRGETARRNAHKATLLINGALSAGTSVANAAIPAAFSNTAKIIGTVTPLIKGGTDAVNSVVKYEKAKIAVKQKDITDAIAKKETGALKEKHQTELAQQKVEHEVQLRRRVLSALGSK